MSALHDLARLAGLHLEWTDALDAKQRVSDDALVSILSALGFPADTDHALAESHARLTADSNDCHFVSGDVGQPIRLPRQCGQPGEFELISEDGSRRAVSLQPDGETLVLPLIDVAGYHDLHLADRIIRLAIAPRRCFSVDDAAPGKRIWGPAVQISSLRDRRTAPYGDFTTLADTARVFAQRGADALAISPVHALFPADPSRYSPYAPSSRLFLNVLYADPTLAGRPIAPDAGRELIDWLHAIPQRMRDLHAAFDGRSDAVRDAVQAYAASGGETLRDHARFDALHAHFFARIGATGWRGWPSEYQDPTSEAVQRFAAENADAVDFYLFLQWLAKQGLDAAQMAAKDAGMAVGLIADLAVGMDGGGSHAWSRRDDLLTGLSIGAPPDLLAPNGQNWGITGFAPRALQRTGFEPFIATLRAALDHAGGIRIDHALGLRRLWVVPDGASAKDGAYLSMPMDDMLRILAIESQRAQAIVIGEDLGTVPEGFRPAMDEKAMLGMRVLPFERDGNDGIIPPEHWSPEAAAMTGTHDLATVAGYWKGRDIDWTWDLGRPSRAKDEADDREKRAADRDRWWHAFAAAGVADTEKPAPENTQPVVNAAIAFVASTPCTLAILPIEDLTGLVEQPNLPGTIDEHPNWRRRMPEPTETLIERPEIAARLVTIQSARAQ